LDISAEVVDGGRYETVRYPDVVATANRYGLRLEGDRDAAPV
jgi:hypothetical protein